VDNGIGDEEARTLGDALKTDTSLTTLNLRCAAPFQLVPFWCISVENGIGAGGRALAMHWRSTFSYALETNIRQCTGNRHVCFYVNELNVNELHQAHIFID